MNEEKKQKISLGNGFIVTFILAVILLVLGFFLWKENSFTNGISNSKIALPTGYPKLKLNINSNFN